MPAVPEGITDFCDMPIGMNFCFSQELLHRFSLFFWWIEQKCMLNMFNHILTFTTLSPAVPNVLVFGHIDGHTLSYIWGRYDVDCTTGAGTARRHILALIIFLVPAASGPSGPAGHYFFCNNALADILISVCHFVHL